MRRLLLAFLLAIIPSSLKAACVVATTGLNLGNPAIGDSGDVWAKCIRNDIITLNASTFSFSGGASTMTSLYVTKSGVIGSTLSVLGNAFSVGGSTLVVNGGKVGIGISSPGQNLVSVSAGGTTIYGGVRPLDLLTNAGDASFATIHFGDSAGSSWDSAIAVNKASMSFVTNGGTVMSLTSGGNVGIGTTNPGALLTVSYAVPASVSSGTIVNFGASADRSFIIGNDNKVSGNSFIAGSNNATTGSQNLDINPNQVSPRGIGLGCTYGTSCTQLYYCAGGTLSQIVIRGNSGAEATACTTGGGTVTGLGFGTQ